MKFFLTFLLFISLMSCDNKVDSVKEQAQVDQHEEEHSHDAPNGGILTEVGEHTASLEWLIEEGQFKIYIFDGCAEKPIRIAQEKIEVSMKVEEEKKFKLAALTNKLTGEKPGDANTFYTEVTELDKEKISSITVHSISIQGIDYKNINLEVK